MNRFRFLLLVLVLLVSREAPAADFRAGAASIDITPDKFPVVVNCGFAENSAAMAHDKLHARALVLDDGLTTIVLVIVDNCMMPREFLDGAKELIATELNLPPSKILIAATHTHTAPAVMGCLGSGVDPNYSPFLERQIVRCVSQAANNRRPAKAGFAMVSADSLTNNRQWILRSDKIRNDPFGKPTVRSNMHPGYLNPDFVGPSGPTDPWLSVLSLRTADDQPLAVLSNFSMHYFGAAPVSSDYFGRVCQKLEARTNSPKFVALHSQGTAGDLHWMDYGQAQKKINIDEYAELVTAKIDEALKKVEHKADISLAMAETKLSLGRRTPDEERLAWAKKLVAALGDQKPKSQPDIYAREAVYLHEEPKRELKLQALRIGGLAIAAIPDEVFAITGLKLRARSPLPAFTIELANGSEGYIPPAEQHVLGGYTTWPARTASLEVGAEAKITEAVSELLAKVSGKPLRPFPEPKADAYAQFVLKGKPDAYWRLGDWAGDTLADLAGTSEAKSEPGVVFGLPGPVERAFDGLAAVNRASHFAGGRVLAKLPPLGENHSVELWFWNGFPADARDWTGTLFTLSKGNEIGDSLVLGGKKGKPNALALNAERSGSPPAEFRTWCHAAYIREGKKVRVYRNGKLEIETEMASSVVPDSLVIGGRPDKSFGFEGRLAEVVVHNRVLNPEEITARIQAMK